VQGADLFLGLLGGDGFTDESVALKPSVDPIKMEQPSHNLSSLGDSCRAGRHSHSIL
jgi:hypothetical protein